MRNSVKIKSGSQHVPLRKSALTASAAARRGFPAWIDSDERIASFQATVVTPRVRDGLVLRMVSKAKPRKAKGLPDGASNR